MFSAWCSSLALRAVARCLAATASGSGGLDAGLFARSGVSPGCGLLDAAADNASGLLDAAAVKIRAWKTKVNAHGPAAAWVRSRLAPAVQPAPGNVDTVPLSADDA